MKKTPGSWFSSVTMKTKYFYFAGLLLMVFLFSCVKEGDFEFDKLAANQYDPSFAAPFINSTITLKELLKDTSGFIQTEADNSLKVVYDTIMDSPMAKDLFPIPSQGLLTDTNSLNFPAVTASDTIYYSITKPFPFTMPDPTKGQRLDSVFIKTAILNLDLNTTINHNGRIILTTPNITYPNGQSFRVEIPITYSGGATTLITDKEFDISGCKIKFNNSPGHPNELIFKYEHFVYGDGNPNLSPYIMQLNDSLKNISYDKLVGYIGFYDIPVQQSIKIPQDYIQELLQYISFFKVGLSADIGNTYGLPIDIHFDTILAKTPNGNVMVSNFPNQNPVGLNYPSIAQIGQSKQTVIPFQQNTSLVTAINKSPTEINFKVSGKLNPGSPTSPSTTTNFVLDTSKFRVGVHVELPLEGRINGFVHSNTIEFDLADKIKNADEVTFKINTSNNFPLDANVQVYFATYSQQIIDSMITSGENVIRSGIVDPATHLVVSPTSKLTEVVISKDRIRKIQSMNTKVLIIKGKLTSYNNGNQDVKLTNANYLNVKLGMKVKINTNAK
jgi:hypothetical protein